MAPGFYPRLFALFCFSGLAFPSELVYFSNGFTLQADSHVQRGDQTQLAVGGGTLEFPSEQIRSIETVIASPSSINQPVAPTASEKRPEVLISEAALAQGIDSAFVRSVAKIESGLRQSSLSNKGAIGLMQLMPGTAKQLGVDPLKPDQNARGGAQYLRSLLLRYKGNSALALAAYNAGPGAIEKFRGIPPYRETQQYVVRVLQEYNKQRLQAKGERKEQQVAARKPANKPSATN